MPMFFLKIFKSSVLCQELFISLSRIVPNAQTVKFSCFSILRDVARLNLSIKRCCQSV